MYILAGGGVCSNVVIDGESTAVTTTVYGFALSGDYQASNVVVQNITTSGTVIGFYVFQSDATGHNITVKNIDQTDASNARGVLVDDAADRTVLTGVTVNDVDNTDTAANSWGIELVGNADNVVVTGIMVTGCSGTGILVNTNCDNCTIEGRSTNNGTNKTDSGTATNDRVDST